MRYLIYLSLSFLIMAPAWSQAQDASIDIGGGLVLEIIPAQFENVQDTSCSDRLAQSPIEWVVVPATFESITETVIVQEAYTDVEVTPIIYNSDGSVKTAAKAKMIEIPAVSKQVTRRVMKTPSKIVQRIVPNTCSFRMKRRLKKSTAYQIKDKSGTTINHFENPESFAEYLNSR